MSDKSACCTHSGNHLERPYTILQQDDIAHIVHFTSHNNTYTGYVIYDHRRFRGRPDRDVIRTVNGSCIVMVKKGTGREVVITVSDPDLRMFEGFVPSSRYIRKDLLYGSRSKGEWLTMSFNENLR